MTTDYSQGRYNVFNASGAHIGRIDEDEFIRQGSTLVYRIDGAELYAVNGGLWGFIDAGVAKKPDGQVLFSIQPE